VPRLTYALLGALALHGLALLVHARHAAPQHAAVAPREEQAIEVIEDPSPDEPSVTEALPTHEHREASSATSPTARERSASREVAVFAPDTNAPGDGDATPTAGPVAAASSAQAEATTAPRKIDLGLDGRFFLRPANEILGRASKTSIQRNLEASLAASDVQHGLARGNVLLGSLNAAVRESGPVRGEALLSVTVGADGSVTDVQFLRGLAADWGAALSAFRELASRKRLRVPAGARGLRVTFSVQAKVQLPSGKEEPVEVASPSLAPNGMTLHGTFDVADLGASAQRMVHARIVSEEVL